MKSLQNAASPFEAMNTPGLGQAGYVMEWVIDPAHYCAAHERITRRALAERIAALQGMQYFGAVSRRPPPRGPLYFIPSDTVESHRAQAIGIRSEQDFFGGAVPFPYVATKAISHPLHDAQAERPHEWVESFAPRVARCVLPGTTAFSEADARRAGRDLLRGGDVRIKPVRATGGNGQTVVQDDASLDDTLARVPDIASEGVVLERNLRAPRTLSIGQVKVGPLTMSYYGLQRTTQNHRGEWVYGGSDLTAVRGPFDALTRLALKPSLRLAIDQAAVFHAAVVESFPGFLASRINYDVAQGQDRSGLRHSGVLEQSWRVGGATGAEVAALEVFKSQPERSLVRASCFEVFGETELPPGACVNYSGDDPEVGRLTKYSFVDAHVDTA
ncbi:DUF3182 family protein [Variovorax saccharolyticus]|uniref:DUF3182 family protein n=1 Tax=Variovorax saccharolyticus TaxID=3053516 RepID=UPI0025752517|nr:DUF3182 family protein [Variovorax sp. J31P216]MDM0028983.1 DUF3182 family protein [Variovorax sp. J31P216]